ncbi:MAG: hypothetical protein K9J13_16475 [Saprospiraceae bacterium]|nr:hypothetical protein [Saprospiraceae bacterium]
MIFSLDKITNTKREIEKLIGKEFTVSERIANKKFGSNIYNLRQIKAKDSNIKNLPQENSRCNFEFFEKGILLRINDNQKLFGIPLNEDEIIKFQLVKGEEKIWPFSLAWLLYKLGVDINILKKFRFVLGGYFYNKRFHLIIITNNEEIILDSNGGNSRKEIKFFSNSLIKEKLEIFDS